MKIYSQRSREVRREYWSWLLIWTLKVTESASLMMSKQNRSRKGWKKLKLKSKSSKLGKMESSRRSRLILLKIKPKRVKFNKSWRIMNVWIFLKTSFSTKDNKYLIKTPIQTLFNINSRKNPDKFSTIRSIWWWEWASSMDFCISKPYKRKSRFLKNC